MANVLFTRAPLSEIEDVQTTQYPVTDGQLLFDTSGSGKMYMDVGTSRLEMGGAMTIDSKLNSTSTNPIQNKAVGGVMLSTLDEINAATSKGFITDALATRALAQKIGTTDISSIGDGTCTGAISSLNAKIDIKYIDKEFPVINIGNDGYAVLNLGNITKNTILTAVILTWSSGNITGGLCIGSSGAGYGYVFGTSNQTVTGLQVRIIYID